MTHSAAVAFLLVPVLVLGGGAAALATTTTEYETHRVAAEAHKSARAEASEALSSAHALYREFRALDADAAVALETAATLQAVSPDRLDATAVAALAPLVERLKAALDAPAPTLVPLPKTSPATDSSGLSAAANDMSGWTAELLAETAAHDGTVDEVDAALRALRTGIMAAAGSVSTTGAAVLDANTSASAESRAALTAAIARLAEHVDEGTSPDTDLEKYMAAAAAVQESHAAAVAAAQAAAAAAGAGGGGGGTRSPVSSLPGMPPLDYSNPPTVVFLGDYGVTCPHGGTLGGGTTLDPGEYFVVDYMTVPYYARLGPVPYSGRWALALYVCL